MEGLGAQVVQDDVDASGFVGADPAAENDTAVEARFAREVEKIKLENTKLMKEVKTNADNLLQDPEEQKKEEDDQGKKLEEGKLKPLDVKDIKKPTEYDGNESKDFQEWYQSLKDLMTSRHEPWIELLDAIESFEGARIRPDGVEKVLANKISPKNWTAILSRWDCTSDS